jgi:hypothetical protein
MQQSQLESALYIAFLKTLKEVGMKTFKESTLFGRNDEVAVKEEIERKAA